MQGPATKGKGRPSLGILPMKASRRERLQNYLFVYCVRECPLLFRSAPYSAAALSFKISATFGASARAIFLRPSTTQCPLRSKKYLCPSRSERSMPESPCRDETGQTSAKPRCSCSEARPRHRLGLEAPKEYTSTTAADTWRIIPGHLSVPKPSDPPALGGIG